mmetsp:Transcript_13697/g.43295  ORF Transcript_13697/g.43295 Transcript_13697/m.43295 type:complete len:719 (+) Transcript_13697:127-2283(+)
MDALAAAGLSPDDGAAQVTEQLADASIGDQPKKEKKEKKKGGAALQEYQIHRIEWFERLQAEQKAHRAEIGGEPIQVTLANGSTVEGKKWLTTPFDIAKGIAASLAKEALISRVTPAGEEGKLWDLSRPLEGDCKVEIFKFDDDEGRDTFWHSSAHILGEALELEYGCKLCIGPCTVRGEGFYYDGFYGDTTLNEGNNKAIEKRVMGVVKEKQNFERIEVTRDQALEIFKDNPFKVELINELPEDVIITVYRCGPLVDLCRGPHIPDTGRVKALGITKSSASYWRGKADRESLQRVYGISYPDKERLAEYMHNLEEAKKRDHRVVGTKQELFFWHELSPGSTFFLPQGAKIYNKLIEFIRGQYRKRGYQEVYTPNIYNMKLWETSGHAANYKDNMFTFQVESQEYGMKPMNCPGHCLMFDHRVRSYRELPLRMADFGVLHRNELSGALSGLTRVRRFQQDDAHIFCMESQVEDEVGGVLNMLDECYGIFGFTFDLELSTRPEKFLGEVEVWDRAEANLASALDKYCKPKGMEWKINPEDGAFYGPKIDITVYDALKRKFQCATVQLDFQLPIRFDLTYLTSEAGKRERPVMVHRAILGSVERMFAILLEHYGGKWPLWLSPRQVCIVPVSEKMFDYAHKVRAEIFAAGFEVEVDVTDRKLQKKVREAQLEQWNYILVVGEEEVNSQTVNIRTRDNVVHGTKSVADLIAELSGEVTTYH